MEKMIMEVITMIYVHLAEGFEEVEALTVVDVLRRAATVDGNIITGQGPALAMEFALAIAENVKGKDTADAVAEDLLYDRK